MICIGLGDLEEKWGSKYPIVIISWRAYWENLTAYFKYPEEIRKVIYTTNTVEGFHRQMRKVLKTNSPRHLLLCLLRDLNLR